MAVSIMMIIKILLFLYFYQDANLNALANTMKDIKADMSNRLLMHQSKEDNKDESESENKDESESDKEDISESDKKDISESVDEFRVKVHEMCNNVIEHFLHVHNSLKKMMNFVSEKVGNPDVNNIPSPILNSGEGEDNNSSPPNLCCEKFDISLLRKDTTNIIESHFIIIDLFIREMKPKKNTYVPFPLCLDKYRESVEEMFSAFDKRKAPKWEMTCKRRNLEPTLDDYMDSFMKWQKLWTKYEMDRVITFPTLVLEEVKKTTADLMVKFNFPGYKDIFVFIDESAVFIDEWVNKEVENGKMTPGALKRVLDWAVLETK